MSRDLLLSIDNGTQSVRALVFDLHGNLLAKARVPLDDYTSPEPGWHEHDAEAFWQSACVACQQVWHDFPQYRERIAGVSVTTQRGTVINIDAKGQPLRPAITWLDQRKSPRSPKISAMWRAAFKLARVDDTIAYFQREAEANWLSACQPDLWKQTHKFLLLSGFLNYRLCGEFVDSVASQVGFLPFDFKKLRWAPASDWKWQAMDIRPEMLPALHEPGTVMSRVCRSAAEASGIPEGTPVLAAAADKACEVLGAGCVEPDIGCLSYGTTATINSSRSKYLEATPFIPPYPGALPGTWNTEIQIFRGYWMVSWFKEQFGHLEQMAEQDGGQMAEELFDELLASVPPGSMGLMLQPYWSPGIRLPGPEAKGAIIGFGDVHTRAHFYRAILEGLAYALREGGERIEKRGGKRFTSLRISGGGSQSNGAMQLSADIFGLPTSRPHVYETSGLGAAIDSAVGLKLYPDFKSAVKEMTRVEREFEPNAQHHAIYDDLYQSVYRKMYERLQPLYADIRRITGYPREYE
ncbi:FGGY-family carbohydrate kinase [Burkholderiaceae bacterium DAT-1]|nr:FGGY-family carbohydrate kinase [Burkholderiaceae bacterium DAT-1]